MSLELTGLIVLAAIALFALFSKRIDQSIVTLPMIFTALGYALSAPVTASAEPAALSAGLRILAETTLVLILFSDASHVRFRKLKHSFVLPTRMLVIGLPLTVALGTCIAYLINPQSGLAMALLTAAVLTPTDAALGQAVVNSPDVPSELSQTINVESGLNDGLALPFVLLGATLVSAEAGGFSGAGHLALQSLVQVAFGPLVGVGVGWGLAHAMDRVQSRDLMEDAAGGVVFVSAAFTAYLVSEFIGGNGFIAAFVAGMTFGNTYKHAIRFISEFMEGVGQILTILAFIAFGAVLLPYGLAHVTLATLGLSVAFLTVVRILPIWLSLLGTGVGQKQKLFLGWFGPRGLASLLFTMIILEDYAIPGSNDLLACVSLTVTLSIILHGMSAVPLSKRLARTGD